GAAARWGSSSAVRFLHGARWIALLLVIAALAAVGLWASGEISVLPVYAILLVEAIFAFAVRPRLQHVLGATATPARDVRLMRLLLARIEREPFKSARLTGIQQSLRANGGLASVEIGRLERLVDRLDWGRNQFFRAFSMPLLWISQHGMAIER